MSEADNRSLLAVGSGFGTILCDAPWPSGSTPKGVKRDRWIGTNMRPRYSTMKAKDILGLPVDQIAAPDAILVMWATWMHLDLAIYVMNEWGFKFSTGMPWLKVTKGSTDSCIKPIYGPGVWMQHCTELVLIGRRGRPFGKMGNPRPARKGIIVSPRGEHSEKPEELRRWIVMKDFPSPRIELFARKKYVGWASWGDGL